MGSHPSSWGARQRTLPVCDVRGRGSGATSRGSSSMKPVFLGVPCFREDAQSLAEAVASFEDPCVDVVLVDNGASPEVKQVLLTARTARVLRNPRNIYINPAWNQLAHQFLRSRREIFALANADTILSRGWGRALFQRTGREEFWFGVLSTPALVRIPMDPYWKVTGEGTVAHHTA